MSQADAPKPGMFITLEGGEGAGKTTNIRLIKERLESSGIRVILTREPGGTEIGEQIRGLLLDPKNINKLCAETELLLMFGARAEHLNTVIYPALKSGAWVVSDRFTDASYAYQGGGRQLEISRISALEAWLHQGFQPDLSLFLDIPVEQGLTRAEKRSEKDRFEQEQTDFFTRVREAYLRRANEDRQRFRVIDASLALAQVQAQISVVLDEFLDKNLS